MDWWKNFGRQKDKPPQPWRTPHTEVLLTLKEKIERYTPKPLLEVPQGRILMIGQIGAGKSSFCNTISSIFSGCIIHPSPCGSATKSFTKVYRQYDVRINGTNRNLNYCLCDTCGIEAGQGPSLEDFKYLLDGNVPDEYVFNANLPISPDIPGFRKRPGLKDQVHCVAFVIDGSTAQSLNDTVWDTLKNVQEEICRRGIPRVILLTKVDKLCTAGDISTVFESSQVGNVVNHVSEKLGIPPHNIHPIKNFEKEMQLNDEISHLALAALEQMIHLANNYLDGKLSSLSRIGAWRQPPREMNKWSIHKLKKSITTYAPTSGLQIQFARILMTGPVDAGKSSFFNTVNSVFSGRITQQIAHGATTAYRQYQIQERNTGTTLKFCLCETCGVENNHSSYLANLKYVIDGNVPDGYTFNSSSPITPSIPGFNIHPGLKDKVHCVVFVIDASTIDTIADSIWEKLNDLQKHLNTMDLPRAVLLTKIDKISQPLHDDLSTVFRSVDVGDAVKKVHLKLGIEENKIHPIKNYEKELLLNDQISTLSLIALDQILGFANDYLSNRRD